MENKLEKFGQNSFMDNFVKTDDILKDIYQKEYYNKIKEKDLNAIVLQKLSQRLRKADINGS